MQLWVATKRASQKTAHPPHKGDRPHESTRVSASREAAVCCGFLKIVQLGDGQNFGWLKRCIRPVCPKKKIWSALHRPPSHSRGKWPSLRWWHKDCVSYLMRVIFWHVGRTAEMLCVTAGGIMAMVGVGLINKIKNCWNWSEQESLLAVPPSELLG